MVHHPQDGKAALVSVVLPVFNAEATLREALASIRAQTYERLEVIAVDDGSSDGSAGILADEAARDKRILVIRTANGGVAAALNVGLARATGEFIARMDADDISEPPRFEKQVVHLEQNSSCVAVGCDVIHIDSNGAVMSGGKSSGSSARMRDRCQDFRHFPPSPPVIPHPTAMIRTDAIRAVGGYRGCFRAAEDRDLWWRLSRLGEIHRLPEQLFRYRMHDSTITRRFPERSVADALLCDLSAAAAHFGVDDSTIRARYESGSDWNAAIAGYAQLLGARYPVRRLAAYRAIMRGYPSVAGYQDKWSVVRYALASLIRDPFAASSLRLVAAAIKA